MARMFVIMLLVHVALISGIILYDFMGDEEIPQQTVTQAARAMASTSGLPLPAPGLVVEQAQAAADTQEFDNYEMRSGDSLKSIAAKFSTNEEEINRLNLIDKGLQIGPGTMLRVPKQAVLSAIPVDPKTLKPTASAEEVPKAVPVQDQPPVPNVPSEAVKPADAPASLSAAALIPMSLVAPSEAPPAASSLAAAADTSATVPAPVENMAALPPPANPRVVSLLDSPPPTPTEEPKQVAQAEPKPLAQPNPVPPPSQLLKKIADKPPATKKAEPVKKTVSTPPQSAWRDSVSPLVEIRCLHRRHPEGEQHQESECHA
jgi:LysM repeat protein